MLKVGVCKLPKKRFCFSLVWKTRAPFFLGSSPAFFSVLSSSFLLRTANTSLLCLEDLRPGKRAKVRLWGRKSRKTKGFFASKSLPPQSLQCTPHLPWVTSRDWGKPELDLGEMLTRCAEEILRKTRNIPPLRSGATFIDLVHSARSGSLFPEWNVLFRGECKASTKPFERLIYIRIIDDLESLVIASAHIVGIHAQNCCPFTLCPIRLGQLRSRADGIRNLRTHSTFFSLPRATATHDDATTNKRRNDEGIADERQHISFRGFSFNSQSLITLRAP